ncbi:MAG TPA: tetratricopeptide repeat protein [Terriglobales bacterium]|nr:tetratricopeptide repeat protein [Terriglobales bacterium]
MRRNLRLILDMGAVCAFSLTTLGIVTHPVVSEHESRSPATAAQQITFNRDIAPIIFANCSVCHRPGEAGPFPLLNYEQVKKHARQIATVTASKYMPPWLPEPGPYKFADERSLTSAQILTIRKWVDGGELEGNSADLPPQPKFASDWQIGKPDMVVSADRAFALPASGTDQYWNFILRVPISETHWLRAVEIRPGDKRIVHHANILVDRMEAARQMEHEGGAGFAGMDLRIESEAFDPDSHFLFWKPGTVPYVYPEGMSLRLDKGTDLVLNTHLQPSGKPEMVQPSVALYFTDKPATLHPMLLQMENDAALDIPPGAKRFLVGDDFKLPIDADLLAIYPHAHYLGKDLDAFAIFPNGTRKDLIHIKQWNLNWQAVYRYERPVALPKGTTISMRYVYDNSEDNIANPNHPPQRVTAGNRSSDEMAHLWLQVLPHKQAGNSEDPRRLLQEALARHDLDKNPANFEARYNLAALLQARGNVAEALPQYAKALQIRPEDALANNAYAGALMSAGRLDEAIQRLMTALKSRPSYFDAHYNLGNVLAMRGDFPHAVAQFRAAVEINPEDANAQTNLGSALAQVGQLSEAKLHFERALEINPNHHLARENLQELQQEMSSH